jgi:hypothetical protein
MVVDGDHDDDLLAVPRHELRAGARRFPDHLAEPLLRFLQLPDHRDLRPSRQTGQQPAGCPPAAAVTRTSRG